MNRKGMLEEIRRLQAENKRLEQRCDAQNAMLNELHARLAHSPSTDRFCELERQFEAARDDLAALHFISRIEGFITIRHVPESESDDGYDPDYWTIEGTDIESYSFIGLLERWKRQTDAEGG